MSLVQYFAKIRYVLVSLESWSRNFQCYWRTWSFSPQCRAVLLDLMTLKNKASRFFENSGTLYSMTPGYFLHDLCPQQHHSERLIPLIILT